MFQHPANQFAGFMDRLARSQGPQHDEHYRKYLNEICERGYIVVRMPDGLLHLEDYVVNEFGEMWVFTEKGTAVFAGVE